jgi:hypothetical protein
MTIDTSDSTLSSEFLPAGCLCEAIRTGRTACANFGCAGYSTGQSGELTERLSLTEIDLLVVLCLFVAKQLCAGARTTGKQIPAYRSEIK